MRTLVFALVVAGCATTQSPAQRGAESAGDPVTEMHTDPSTDNPPKRKTPSPPSTPPSSQLGPSTPGTIRRSELATVLDRSPGYFLQHVQTEPRFAAGRFHGWRLVSFFPGDTRFAGVDLQAGDVVTRINGRAIEQPEQFMTVWTELRSSKELVVDVERDGAPRTLRWIIADK